MDIFVGLINICAVQDVTNVRANTLNIFLQVIFTLNYTLNYLEMQRQMERGDESVHKNHLSTEQLIQHYKCSQLDEIIMK